MQFSTYTELIKNILFWENTLAVPPEQYIKTFGQPLMTDSILNFYTYNLSKN